MDYFPQNIKKTNNSVNVNGNINIASDGAITFENGTSILNITGNLTLLSTDGIKTARIGEIPSGSSLLGNITAQRHVPISTTKLA